MRGGLYAGQRAGHIRSGALAKTVGDANSSFPLLASENLDHDYNESDDMTASETASIPSSSSSNTGHLGRGKPSFNSPAYSSLAPSMAYTT